MSSAVVIAAVWGSKVIALSRGQCESRVGRLVVSVCEVAIASEATDVARRMRANGASGALRTIGFVIRVRRELHAALPTKTAAIVRVAKATHGTATLVCDAMGRSHTRRARVVALSSLLLRWIGLVHKGLVRVGCADLVNCTGNTSFKKVGLGGGCSLIDAPGFPVGLLPLLLGSYGFRARLQPDASAVVARPGRTLPSSEARLRDGLYGLGLDSHVLFSFGGAHFRRCEGERRFRVWPTLSL